MENSEGPPPEDWELTQRTFGGHYVLNWSNPFVQEEYRKALDHWLEAGVDGFYMKHLDTIHVLNPHHLHPPPPMEDDARQPHSMQQNIQKDSSSPPLNLPIISQPNRPGQVQPVSCGLTGSSLASGQWGGNGPTSLWATQSVA
ncbi:uncharacterized protein TNIN_459761 [Trichonephila inaurata madagascariensis]|uniref:Uncharacterized protein n=1 Tax=Trichonephila inaurata madagascariensis TaxID=2747483 RepID=A0A8X7BSG2_9ARAC|nr:uncharacterized protein TNIN_459761 [Trichonephila inaurata madagascariensis]